MKPMKHYYSILTLGQIAPWPGRTTPLAGLLLAGLLILCPGASGQSGGVGDNDCPWNTPSMSTSGGTSGYSGGDDQKVDPAALVHFNLAPGASIDTLQGFKYHTRILVVDAALEGQSGSAGGEQTPNTGSPVKVDVFVPSRNVAYAAETDSHVRLAGDFVITDNHDLRLIPSAKPGAKILFLVVGDASASGSLTSVDVVVPIPVQPGTETDLNALQDLVSKHDSLHGKMLVVALASYVQPTGGSPSLKLDATVKWRVVDSKETSYFHVSTKGS